MGLEMVEIIMEIEERYDITLDENDAPDLRTFGDCVEAVHREVNRTREATMEEVEEGLRIIFCEQMWLKPEKVRWESDLKKDLGIG